MIRLKNIVVAHDFGEAADTALAYGRELAGTFKATLHVFHAVDNVVTRFTVDTPIVGVEDLQSAMDVSARTRLEALVTEHDRTAFNARTAVCMAASPAVAIVGYAEAVHADIVLVGTHGRGAIAHFFLGSVAERVVRMAPCPVLTVHHPQREFVRPDALAAAAHR